MASEQASRGRENTASELEIPVETEEVLNPKMTIQFESPAAKERAWQETQPADESLEREGRETAKQAEATDQQDREGTKEEEESSDDKQLESLAEKVKTIDVGGQKGGHEGGERESHRTTGESLAGEVEKIQIGGEETHGQSKGHEEEAQPTLEEVSRLRASAQQNSMDILRAAEERYSQAKEQAKEMANQGLDAASEKAAQSKETVLHGARATTEYVEEKGAAVKEKAVDKGQHGLAAAEETVISAGKTAKDHTVLNAEQELRTTRCTRPAEAKGKTVERVTRERRWLRRRMWRWRPARGQQSMQGKPLWKSRKRQSWLGGELLITPRRRRWRERRL